MTLFAQIILGVPVDGPFDYSIPDALVSFAKPGCRARVNFRNKKQVGYIVGISGKPSVKIVKPLIDVIDRQCPLLTPSFLELSRQLALYYCCSWGMAVEAGLPLVLRKGKPLDVYPSSRGQTIENLPGRSLLLFDLDGNRRLCLYEEKISGYLEQGLSVIMLAPDRQAAYIILDAMQARFGERACLLERDTKDELVQWLRVFSMKPVIAIGTRSAVFAPVQRPGCIIIDDEQDYGYKQDQSPHYHSRTVAMMRCRIEHCDFVAGSPAPSLELMYEAQSGNIKFEAIPRSRPWPAIKIVDMKKLPLLSKRQKITISGYLQNEVVASAAAGEKYCFFQP